MRLPNGAARPAPSRSGARALLLAAAGLALSAVGTGAQDAPVRERTVYEDLQMFSQVLNQIRVNHPDTVDAHTLFMAAIEGMVRAADPHSYVIPVARLSPEKERAYRAGELVPVPLAFRYIGGAPVVVSVKPGTSAAAAGVVPGDELVAIDGDPVRAASVLELEVVLAGPDGTDVTLTFRRRRMDGSTVRVDRVVAREESDPTGGVPVAVMLDQTIGYVRLTTFSSDEVASDLDEALDGLEDQGMEGLVLDLRDNGGGLVHQAAAVAGAFLPRNAVVYTTSGRKEAVVDTGRVHRSFWRSGRDYPVVLMVNEGTASAAELVAGAFQDYDRALLVGRPTFGKALVMQPFPLTDGSMMMLVVGKVHTPCGRTIQRQYHDISTREYYRAAGEERDRAGLETCTTAAGRTVYGGRGIYPDHLLEAPRPTPRWLDRIQEEDLLLRWVPGLLEDRPDRYGELAPLLDRPALEPEDLDAFLDFATTQGVEIPDDDQAHQRVESLLLARIVTARFGARGLYELLAYRDPDVREAAGFMDEARTLLDQQP